MQKFTKNIANFLLIIIVTVMQQVNFSELNQLKKKEFFNYLLSNNIQFKQGESNYYARVVLKPSKENVNNSSINKVSKSKGKENQKEKQREKQMDKPKGKEKSQMKTAVKQIMNSRPRQKDKDSHYERDREKENRQPLLKFTSKQRELLLKRPPFQRLSTPTRSHSPFIIASKRKQLSLSDYSLQIPLNLSDIIAATEKSAKSKTQRSNTNKSATRDNSNNKNKHKEQQEQRVFVPKFGGFKEKEPSFRHQEKSPAAIKTQYLISPYLRIFKISNTIISRPSKLSRHQLDRAIEEIYSASFSRNNAILKTKKFKQTLEMQNVFASFITQHYDQKYKIRKSVQFNLVNLLFSLVCHMQIEKSRNLVIFSRFIKEEYHYQDLIFFLFVRNLAQKQIRQEKSSSDKKIKDEYQDFKFFLGEKEVVKLIKALVGKDQELLDEYIELIDEYRKDGVISIYEILEILLENYYRKRQNTSTNRCSHPSNISPSNKNICHTRKNNFISRPVQRQTYQTYQIPTESDSQQLTFGESTVRNRECHNDTFWYQTNQKADIPADPLEVMIVQKMDKKISDLIKYILDDDQDFRLTVAQFHGLIFNKARNLVKTVFEMDKLGWFKLLNIREPDVEKMAHVEGLQKMVRAMKAMGNEADGIMANRFCKSILTTEEFLGAIKKIVIG